MPLTPNWPTICSGGYSNSATTSIVPTSASMEVSHTLCKQVAVSYGEGYRLLFSSNSSITRRSNSWPACIGASGSSATGKW